MTTTLNHTGQLRGRRAILWNMHGHYFVLAAPHDAARLIVNNKEN